jgi:hypothetical protein
LVREILVLHSTAIVAKIVRRSQNGAWPEQPDIIAADGELRSDSFGFAAPLRDVYRTSGLS